MLFGVAGDPARKNLMSAAFKRVVPKALPEQFRDAGALPILHDR